jgi:hypothetical protein
VEPAFPYFAWAFEHLPETAPVSQVLQTYQLNRQIQKESVVELLRQAYQVRVQQAEGRGLPGTYKYESSVSPASLLIAHRNFDRQFSSRLLDPPIIVLQNPRKHFGADNVVLSPAMEEGIYQSMLAFMIGALDGDNSALQWLGVIMLRGGLNRQFTVRNFVRVVLRDDQAEIASLPDRGEIEELSQRLTYQGVSESLLDRLMSQYLAFALG